MVVPVMDASRGFITQNGRRENQSLREPPPISPDAPEWLVTLTLIEKIKVTANGSMIMEMFSRAYTKMTTDLMGDTGSLMIMAVMICSK
jgi:hypothetical protein